jgi:hypothetical protein
MTMPRSVLKPDRIRKIQGSFAFVEHRFLRDGFFESLEKTELNLYFFLVLVGDRTGQSWYAYDRICAMLRLTVEEYIEARNNLVRKDLIAFDGHVFQVLSLPQTPVRAARPLLKTREDMERGDPATIQQSIEDAFGIHRGR